MAMRFDAALAGTLLWLAAMGCAAGARAADMPLFNAGPGYAADPAPAGPPLEFGSGWYLRGDGAFGPEDQPKLFVTPAGAASFHRNASGIGSAFGLGAGYKFNAFLRADITGDYLDPFKYSASVPCETACTLNMQSETQRWDLLANGYVDLGSWWGISPYVGAGVGVGGTVADGKINVNGLPLAAGLFDPQSGRVITSSLPTRNEQHLAWAAMAGFSYPVSPNLLLDVGYRYLDFGKTSLRLFPVASVSRDITSNQVRMGLRYMVE